ncbi:MAG: 50S ribosome-binding GTPase, partial [Lachnospiraceae bacterium]|nr:50S ribosome-binding GTPase [Lachnospiraceae bacterium]
MNSDYEVQIEQEWEEFKKNEVYPNILLLGMTGCGKSSLINTVFGGALAEVNDTTPETQGFKKFEGKNTGQHVNIIDSKGYELEHNEGLNNYVSNLKAYIDSKNGTENEIHLVWYCISVAGKRIQDMDISILKEVSNIERIKDKMCVVLTKCDEDDEIGSVAEKFKEIVDNETGGFLRVFQVSHLKELPLELENLICWSAEQLTDEDMRVSFVAGQKWSLELKKEEANRVINLAVAAAGAATIVPLPIATSPALVAIQFRMVMGITKVFGFQNMSTLT